MLRAHGSSIFDQALLPTLLDLSFPATLRKLSLLQSDSYSPFFTRDSLSPLEKKLIRLHLGSYVFELSLHSVSLHRFNLDRGRVYCGFGSEVNELLLMVRLDRVLDLNAM